VEPNLTLETVFFLFGEIPHLLCNQEVIATGIQPAFHFV